MHRRDFLRATLVGGAVALGAPVLAACSDDGDRGADDRSRPTRRSLTEGMASDAPVDTVVVVMMENRSFDHFLGWLATDEAYLEQGRSRYGGDFGVTARRDLAYETPDGARVSTRRWIEAPGEANPYRGCGHPDPGHGWTQGRAQLEGGFLASDSGNDAYALGYYDATELPFTAELARRFTTFDHWHASVLAPTYPNREYLHSAQSGGNTANVLPTGDGFQWDTIWDRLRAAQVPAGYYASDLPTIALWGSRLGDLGKPIDAYFDDAAAGRLPNVVMVDPAFLGDARTDDHPHADIRAGQRFLRDVFVAFARSPHWNRGVFVVTYDEWGGFFDHVTPPRFADDRGTDDLTTDFAQSGFRVPGIVASPYAPRGAVVSTPVEHTSILRFIEWRFLGAPAAGPSGDEWWLTTRDRNAFNLGEALVAEDPDPDVGFDLDVGIDDPSPGCDDAAAPTAAGEPHSFQLAYEEGAFERLGWRVEPSSLRHVWARGNVVV